MKIKLRNLFWFLLVLFQFSFIHSQENLSEKENYFLSRQVNNSTINPMDKQIGFLEDNVQILQIIKDFIIEGPEKENSLESMLPILIEKYVPIKNRTPAFIRISKNNEIDNRYESDIRLVFGENSLLCTIYLFKSEDKWYIEDFQIN